MTRRKKGRDVSGWLALDKPVGMTSTAAVASIKRLFAANKVGHAGTLDPLASGMLPIALGEATKTVSHVQDGSKIYRFTVRWGVETDTDDSEGREVATSDRRPDRAEIESVLPEFIGEIMQRPPAFSAIKVGGERAYDLARGGEEVTLDERPVVIDRLALVEAPDGDHAIFEAECGKGTYVRALARDLGRRLDTFGQVVALRRLTVGPFDESTMVTPDRLTAERGEREPEILDRFLRPLGFALTGLPEIAFAATDAARIRRGQSVLLRGRDAPVMSGEAHATSAGESIAIGEIERGAFHPKRVFAS